VTPLVHPRWVESADDIFRLLDIIGVYGKAKDGSGDSVANETSEMETDVRDCEESKRESFAGALTGQLPDAASSKTESQSSSHGTKILVTKTEDSTISVQFTTEQRQQHQSHGGFRFLYDLYPQLGFKRATRGAPAYRVVVDEGQQVSDSCSSSRRPPSLSALNSLLSAFSDGAPLLCATIDDDDDVSFFALHPIDMPAAPIHF